jgi:hypothetical protein
VRTELQAYLRHGGSILLFARHSQELVEGLAKTHERHKKITNQESANTEEEVTEAVKAVLPPSGADMRIFGKCKEQLGNKYLLIEKPHRLAQS